MSLTKSGYVLLALPGISGLLSRLALAAVELNASRGRTSTRKSIMVCELTISRTDYPIGRFSRYIDRTGAARRISSSTTYQRSVQNGKSSAVVDWRDGLDL
jgi:hypothetical protein